MDSSSSTFESVLAALSNAHPHVEAGNMMGLPGILYKGKVFAFINADEMCFRIGREFEPAAAGIGEYRLLNPFKKKPPMKDWFDIPSDYRDQWEALALQALELMQAKVDRKKRS